MLKKSKVIAMYLPQYHIIEENNTFWGEGFTDWVTVKNAKQYIHNQHQPNIPLNEKYYDLSDVESIRWQCELAKKYGINAFCFYHYWFSSKKNLLSTPAELFLNDKTIDMEICMGWDNAPWKRTWSTQYGNAWAPMYDKNMPINSELLIELDYEDEKGWKKHFDYLLPFFKDHRYIKLNGKPIFLILNYYKADILAKMIKYWNILAIEAGFTGIYIIGRHTVSDSNNNFDAEFLYQPIYSGWSSLGFIPKAISKATKIIGKDKPTVYKYDLIWKRLLKQSKEFNENNIFYGAFVNYDDTPRRGTKGKLIVDASPQKFKSYFKEILELSSQNNKELIFLTAWNEWGEGAYLEPDEKNGYAYLNAVKEALIELDEI